MNNYLKVLAYLKQFEGDGKMYEVKHLLPELSYSQKKSIFRDLADERYIKLNEPEEQYLTFFAEKNVLTNEVKVTESPFNELVNSSSNVKCKAKITIKGSKYLRDERNRASAPSEVKKDEPHKLKELLLNKILFLQKERILATDANVKFKLAHEIAELELELDIFQNLQESNKISAEYLSLSKENQYKKSNHINNLQNIQTNRNKTVLPETYKYEIRGDSVIYWHPDGRETKLSLINSASGTVMSNRNSKVSKLKRSGERARIKLESWIKLFDKILKEYNSK